MSNWTQFKKNYLCDIAYLIKKYVNLQRIFYLLILTHLNLKMVSRCQRNVVLSIPIANFCLFLLHDTFAREDSIKTFAKSFDSFAILSSRNDPLGKACLLTIHPLE